MIIDNKTTYNKHDIHTVAQFIERYSTGDDSDFNIVTGFFSIYGLLFLKNQLNQNINYKMVLAQMVADTEERDLIVNLLQEDSSIQSVLQLRSDAEEAVKFLQRPTVEIKSVLNAFCHAKTYLYNEKDERNSYYVVGSSNLTEAGLGIKYSSNIEMNTAVLSENETYNDLTDWFHTIWDKIASDKIEDEYGNIQTIKDYIIEQIKRLFKEYSPEEIYYKILFELFQRELEFGNINLNDKEMKRLRDTEIWKTLYPYQKSGVISLIKMLKAYDGAILADAVGLGKTFSALAVMYYFQTNGYKVLMLCPKKLEHNWTQYLKDADSRFEEDGFDYVVRFHTDLQEIQRPDGTKYDRLEDAYERPKLSKLQKEPKLLIVIDESHNLRNDQSNRYKYLVDKLIKDPSGKKDRKILLLSATPINNGLKDVRNQFNLIGKDKDDAFRREEFQINSLEALFAEAQRKFTQWCSKDDRKISDFINSLPQKFFNLTDRLIVARTRKIIEKTLNEKLSFPAKKPPLNIYKCLDKFGTYKSTLEIYDALMKINLTAYQPSMYMEVEKSDKKKNWQDNRFREKFLVKMMSTLFLKRLESSWYSCLLTIEKVYTIHDHTLQLVNDYLKNKTNSKIEVTEIQDEDEDEMEYTLRNGEIDLKKMVRIQEFKNNLEMDVLYLKKFYDNLKKFKEQLENKKKKDEKLEALKDIINEKKAKENKKILIFTTYGDTAEYIYNDLIKSGYKNVACVTGETAKDWKGYSSKKFNEIIERFSPYSKLFKEKNYTDRYVELGIFREFYNETEHKWDVPYDKWVDFVKEYYPKDYDKINNPIDILVTTDCLSEGQNLQDADMVVNYDIHWNPVRLIQRFGRIDRLGSKNEEIQAVNFWPTPNFDIFIKLTDRINTRMATMVLANTETTDTTEELKKMLEDNPLIDKNAAKLLKQMEKINVSEIDDTQTVTLADLSLELFRQDLMEYLDKNKEKFRKMPTGIFSGFKSLDDKIKSDSIVAVVGYPCRKPNEKKHIYTDIYLMLQPSDKNLAPQFVELNRAQILTFLRQHKDLNRSVPQWLDHDTDKNKIKELAEILRNWMTLKAPQQSQKSLFAMLDGDFDDAVSKEEAKVTDKEKFKLENFDLIVWEYITKY